jgi:uncharacterized membrane protein (UPF0127 family)
VGEKQQQARSSGTAKRIAARFAGIGGERRRFCVYNKTRECFLSLGVTAADNTLARLRGLIGRFKLRSDEGIWVVPSSGVHTIGVMVPLDLIYLDDSHRVIHVAEHFPTFRIAPIRADSESVLELPTHTIYSSQTQIGDQLLICAAEEMERYFSCTSPAGPDRNAVTLEV